MISNMIFGWLYQPDHRSAPETEVVCIRRNQMFTLQHDLYRSAVGQPVGQIAQTRPAPPLRQGAVLCSMYDSCNWYSAKPVPPIHRLSCTQTYSRVQRGVTGYNFC